MFGVVQVLGLSICKAGQLGVCFRELLPDDPCLVLHGRVWVSCSIMPCGAFFLALRRVAACREKAPGNSLAKAFAKKSGAYIWRFHFAGMVTLGNWLALPGSVDWDSHTQICQALDSMEMTAHHTVLSTWLHGGLVQLGRLFGSDNLGVFLYVLLQCLACAWIYGQIVAFCAKLKAPRWLQYAVTAFFALVPVWGAFAQSYGQGYVVRSGLFAICSVYGGCLDFFRRVRGTPDFVWALWRFQPYWVCLLRNNGVIAVFPVLLLMGCRAARKRKNWKRSGRCGKRYRGLLCV